MRVAVDASAPGLSAACVVAGALAATSTEPSLTLVLVGPEQDLAAEVAARGAGPHVGVLAGEPLPAGPAAEIERSVRRGARTGARVAARLLRDGAADALVGLGPTAATVAAATFTLPAARGIPRPPLAVRVGSGVLLDVSGHAGAAPGELAAFAAAGVAYATALGRPDPAVVELVPGGEPAFDPATLVAGTAREVVVTDGFTGELVRRLLAAAGAEVGVATLLGLDGVVVAAEGAAGLAGPAAAAVRALRAGTVAAVAEAAERLVRSRLVAS